MLILSQYAKYHIPGTKLFKTQNKFYEDISIPEATSQAKK